MLMFGALSSGPLSRLCRQVVRHSKKPQRQIEVKYMRNSNQFGDTVKRHREALGLTQRSLAQKLGVEPSHVAFIESGRRKPSLKLLARLADVLDLDRQDLLVQAHPEAEGFIAETKPERRKTSPSWRRFIENKRLLARYNVTDRELRALEGLSFLGTVDSAKEFLAILTLIRDIPAK
jgi:transcriptional regulator with XRE-family HTH domain